MMHLLPAVSTLRVTKTAIGPEEQELIRRMLDEWRKGADQASANSKRGDHRLITFLIEEETTLERMHMRLQNLSKYGETFPDIDTDEIITAFRRKRGN